MQLPVQLGSFLSKQDAFRNTGNVNIIFTVVPQWPNSDPTVLTPTWCSGDLFLCSNCFRREISADLVWRVVLFCGGFALFGILALVWVFYWGFFFVGWLFFQLEEYQQLLKGLNRQKSSAHPQSGPYTHIATVLDAKRYNLHFFQIILWLNFHTSNKLYFLKNLRTLRRSNKHQ